MTEGRIAVRLVARAGRNQLVGMRDGVLQARVSAPPIDGEANKALCRIIAKRLEIAPSKVKVIQGKKSRQKVVGVESLDKATLERLLRGRDR